MVGSTLACKVAKQYLDCINGRDVDGLRKLFAETADYTGPDGVSLTEREKIVAGYKRGWDNPNHSYPKYFEAENIVPFGDDGSLLEFGWLDDKGKIVLAAVDRFEVNKAGQITRFLPYFASSQLARIMPQVERLKALAASEKAKA
jgi:hypothetical protein